MKSLIAIVCVAFLGGCASVGPVAKQGAAGQDSANSPQNKATYTQQPTKEGLVSTFTADTTGATRETLIDESGAEVRGSAEVRTDLVVILPDGTRLTNISGKDVYLDEFTGSKTVEGSMGFTLKGLRTSASDPTRAMNEALDRLDSVFKKFAEEQRASIEAQSKLVADTVAKAIEAAVKAAVPTP